MVLMSEENPIRGPDEEKARELREEIMIMISFIKRCNFTIIILSYYYEILFYKNNIIRTINKSKKI